MYRHNTLHAVGLEIAYSVAAQLCRQVVMFATSLVWVRGIASSKQVRGPQHNMLTIANVNQDIKSILK